MVLKKKESIMILNLGEKEYDVATNIGVSYDIEQQHRKKITKVIENIEDLTIKEMCDLMYVGVKRKNKDITFNDFFNDIIDSGISLIDLQKEFTVFITLLTSSNKTESEVREKLEEAYNKNIEKYKNEYEDELEEYEEVLVDDEKN